MLKLIQFTITGHALFEDGTIFSIAATGRNESRTRTRVIDYGGGLFLNKTIGVVGINATGKSTLFNLFEGLSDLYLQDLAIAQTKLQRALRGTGAIRVEADLADTDGMRYRVETRFEPAPAVPADVVDPPKWVIAEEVIAAKRIKTIQAKRKQFVFTAADEVARRSALPEAVAAMLSAQNSAFRAYRGDRQVANVQSLVDLVDTNFMLTFADQTPPALVQYLDPSIESLQYQYNDAGTLVKVTLKFKGDPQPIVAPDFATIQTYLSSGTIRGITLFFWMVLAFRRGATLLIDEVELHINKRIVQDFIGFFYDPRINVEDATLVYSTHYIELLDDAARMDENFILTRAAQTQVRRYSTVPELRPELKRSEVFASNQLGGTAPQYEQLLVLKSALRAQQPVTTDNAMRPAQ